MSYSDTQESPQEDSEITEHQNGILVTTAGQDLSVSTSLAGGDEYADIPKIMQIFSEQEAVRAVYEADTSLQDQILPCAEATVGEDACCSGTGDLSPPVLLLSDSKAVLQSENGVFCPHADHPTCISLREVCLLNSSSGFLRLFVELVLCMMLRVPPGDEKDRLTS